MKNPLRFLALLLILALFVGCESTQPIEKSKKNCRKKYRNNKN